MAAPSSDWGKEIVGSLKELTTELTNFRLEVTAFRANVESHMSIVKGIAILLVPIVLTCTYAAIGSYNALSAEIKASARQSETFKEGLGDLKKELKEGMGRLESRDGARPAAENGSFKVIYVEVDGGHFEELVPERQGEQHGLLYRLDEAYLGKLDLIGSVGVVVIREEANPSALVIRAISGAPVVYEGQNKCVLTLSGHIHGPDYERTMADLKKANPKLIFRFAVPHPLPPKSR